MENLNTCPVCGATSLNNFLEVKDHFLSKESFSLSQCSNCSFVFTNPRPDTNNLEKYYQSEDYFSHSKKKKGLITILYDLVKNYSLNRKFKLISSIKSTGKVLDIGCATGEFLNYFKNKGWTCFGIEPAENPRNYAINNYQLDVVTENALDSFEKESFDLITMWHVLEHVPNLNERIQQIDRLLKPDGLLIIALPNYLSWDAEHYKSFWAGYDVPRHLYHFSPQTISTLLSKYCISIINTVPLKFDSFYVSLLSEKYKSGKMNFSKAFINGLMSNLKAKKRGNTYSSLIYLARKRLV